MSIIRGDINGGSCGRGGRTHEISAKIKIDSPGTYTFLPGIYLPSAALNVRGNGSTLCTTLPVVANTIKVEETSTLSGTAFVSGGTPTTVIALID